MNEAPRSPAEELKVFRAKRAAQKSCSDKLSEESGDRLHLKLQLFDAELAQRVKANTDTTAVVRALIRAGSIRRLIAVPPDYRQRCEALSELYPNFQGFIERHLLPDMALSDACHHAFQMAPTLLLGPPGIGKSMLIQEGICQSLLQGEMPFKRFNFETSQASFELLGTSRGWADYQPGQLFRWLSETVRRTTPVAGFPIDEGQPANGFVIGEELDKGPGPRERMSTMNALIQLLEPMTAQRFADQAVPELALDLSRVNFLFTANSLDGIPEPVLSRLCIVEVGNLTRDQAEHIAYGQYMQLAAKLDLPFKTPEITSAGVRMLSRESPRRQRLLLRQAMGRAVAYKSSVLEFPSAAISSKSPMGFV